MNVVKQRPEGPPENSPGREAGARDDLPVEHRRCGTRSASRAAPSALDLSTILSRPDGRA